ncbi:MAG: VCBS repeat-containing protein [Planctomycetes bacterium]|jgi:hypothetical protein|nr:VCBS repeat-containing protein [Planctomycetota bacterium]MCL4730614.1 VCBS repeat-containing protein [Planctomycetota bacterium]
MQPQFVDFNADGHADIVTATFDGSPWVSFGSEKGFQAPKTILDKDGKRMWLSQYYDWDKKQWTKSDRTGGKAPDAHCISAVAFDWDADGDFDLILGDYGKGLFLVRNEGSNAEPKFTGKPESVMVGDKPLDAGDKITAPRFVDWDGDGLADIVLGTFGDAWGAGKGGSVLLFRNTGKKGEPRFEPAKVLIEASPKTASSATRPDAGLYLDVADLDGDGRLDLVVGGYSLWKDEVKPGDRPSREATASRKPYVWAWRQKSEKAAPAKGAEN